MEAPPLLTHTSCICCWQCSGLECGRCSCCSCALGPSSASPGRDCAQAWGSHSQLVGELLDESRPCRSLASSSDPSDPIRHGPQVLFLWGEQGSIPLPSISEHPWETTAGLSCPQHHPWLGGSTHLHSLQVAQWGWHSGDSCSAVGEPGGDPCASPLLWAGDGDAALVEPGRGKVSSRGLPGVCPIS